MSYQNNLRTDSQLRSLLSSFLKPDEVLDIINMLQQEPSKDTCMLPKTMYPNKDTFESLGFSFKDIGDSILYESTLPDGWTVAPDFGNYHWYNFFDENKHKRGAYCYSGNLPKPQAYMNLSQRFYVTQTKISNGKIKVGIKDTDGNFIFTAGTCAKQFSSEFHLLFQISNEYLEKYFPDWENPTKYWNLDFDNLL